MSQPCEYCGKTDFDFANGAGPNCLDAVVLDPAVGGWVCKHKAAGAHLDGDAMTARAYAEQHGAACAREILVWRKTGHYQGRFLASLMALMGNDECHDGLQLAEDLVVKVALEALARK